MILPVELAHHCRGALVILAELFFSPIGIVTLPNVVVPHFHTLHDRLLRRQVAQILGAILEPRLCVQEHQIHLANRPVALLGQDQFRQPCRSSRSRL